MDSWISYHCPQDIHPYWTGMKKELRGGVNFINFVCLPYCILCVCFITPVFLLFNYTRTNFLHLYIQYLVFLQPLENALCFIFVPLCIRNYCLNSQYQVMKLGIHMDQSLYGVKPFKSIWKNIQNTVNNVSMY